MCPTASTTTFGVVGVGNTGRGPRRPARAVDERSPWEVGNAALEAARPGTVLGVHSTVRDQELAAPFRAAGRHPERAGGQPASSPFAS